MVVVFVACGTNTHKMPTLSTNTIKKDSTKIVEVKQDTTVNIEEPIKLRTLVCKFGNVEKKPNTKDSLKPESIDIDTSKVYFEVDQMPQFPGGEVELLKFVHNNLKNNSDYDCNPIMGKVVCRFIIDIDGSVKSPEVIRSLDRYFDAEAIRVIKLLPKFIPGKQNSKNVRVWYTIL